LGASVLQVQVKDDDQQPKNASLFMM